MKNMKKMIALLLAMVMVMGTMSMTAFAAAGDRTADTTISVTDLTVGDVVTPYQVIEWKENTGWAFTETFKTLTPDDLKEILGTPAVPDDPATTDVDESKPAVPGKITQAMANKIAKLATGGTADPALTTTTWSKSNPAPGLYMVAIAAKKSGVVYNPAFVGADFEGSNTTNTISITATYSDTAVAKKTNITTLKTVDENEDSPQIKAAKASMVGDIVSFHITTTIPVFLDSYKNPSFKLTDEISTGMELVVDATHPITVKYGDTSATCTGDTGGDTNVTITKNSTTKYTAEFAKDYLDANAVAVDVVVTYYAKITNAATFTVNRDENTVKVEYSNGPNNEKGVEKDVTNHYTFSVGAKINGHEGKKGYEAVKTGVDKDGNELQELTEVTLDDGFGQDKLHALEGALFGLYTSEAAAKAAKKPGDANNGLVVNKNYPNGATYTTTGDGIITFTGLDAGKYYLAEIDAPNGYIKDTTVAEVVITAEYVEKNYTETVDGMEVTFQTSELSKHTVTVNGNTTTYEYDNTGTADVDPVIKDITTEEMRFKNTKGQELPSTGGIGTTMFYVVGSILVLGAAVLLISKRRMNAR